MTSPFTTIAALELAATQAPDAVFLRLSGQQFTFAEAYAHTTAVAAGLGALGVQRGDRVALMCDNRPEAIWLWFGANAIGAVDVPVNIEGRGEWLSYVIADADPRIVVATGPHLETMARAGVTPEYAVVIGEADAGAVQARAHALSFDELTRLGGSSMSQLPGPADVASMIYTSGTTGPSKGVLVPQGHWPDQGELLKNGLRVTQGEVVYSAQPLFHQDARTFVQIALAARATAVLAGRFSVRRFWDDIRAHDVDVFGCIGTMMWLLFKQEPTPHDADQPARVAGSAAVPPEIHRKFEQRFGVEIHQWYGQTETGCVTSTLAHGRRPGSIGRPTASFEVKLVDEHDRDVHPGETGELCCRPRQPNVMMAGYWQKPEATVNSCRNLWFHTGDLVRQAEDGEFEYVGRKNDAIRRRGENISAWEVEQAAARHDHVLEAAAFGVPSPVGEEDVALLVVVRAGAQLEASRLHRFMGASLPGFAVPRFIEFVDALPKTPSERVEKAKVRARGLTAAAWDASATIDTR